MSNRRAFLKQAGLAAVSASLLAPAPAPALIEPTQVPDTLDLADHGRMALNGLLGTLDPAVDYECVFKTITDVHPPYMLHWSTMLGMMCKYMEAVPLKEQLHNSYEYARQMGINRLGIFPTGHEIRDGPSQGRPNLRSPGETG